MTVALGRTLLAGTVALPLLGMLGSLAAGGALGRGHRWVVALGWSGALMALGALVTVALGGPFGLEVGPHSQPVVGLWADQLTVTLVTLICLVGAVVQSFSLRYLQGDRSAGRFLAGVNGVLAGMAVVCTSATLAGLVGAWLAVGGAFVAVLSCRRDLPGVRGAVRRTAGMFALGDAALVVALALVWLRAGNLDLVAPGALEEVGDHLGGLRVLVALLVVGAALTRSAQGVLGRWLPGTVAAPTPASALLHAGVVNGGGILLLRLGALSGGSEIAMAVLFVVAGTSAVVAAQAMTRRPDVKGSLVFSTKSQMGFMVAECAVGADLAALVHLLGHALYKATLFLGSGAQVPRPGAAAARRARPWPRWMRVLASGSSAGAAVGVMVAVPGVLADRGGVVLAVFAAATAVSAAWSWWEEPPGSGQAVVVLAGGLLGAGALYGLVLGGLARWIGPALAAPGAGVLSPWWLLAVAGAGLLGVGLARVPGVRQRLLAVVVDAAAGDQAAIGPLRAWTASSEEPLAPQPIGSTQGIYQESAA